MFKIDIKEDFKKIYGANNESIKCYKTCCGIVLYGAGFDDRDLCMGGLSLSVDTLIAIKTNNNKNFRIIFSDSDTQYECELDKLKTFVGDKLAKSMFEALAMTRGSINGADILIEYSINDKRFQRPLTSLISGLGINNNGKIADIEFVKCLINTNEDVYSFVPCELYGRKNTLLNRDKNGRLEYLPFNLDGYKIVLSLMNDKGFDMKNILSDSKFKNYIINEEKRAELIKDELIKNGTITEKTDKIFKTSAYELLCALGKNADKLLTMYKISEETGLASAIVPLYSYFGVCAFVPDDNVDKYVKTISEEYQKKVGTLPTLCICDSCDSGIEIRH